MSGDREVQRRNEKFVERTQTNIWREFPTANNPYVAERALCHGYDVESLVGRLSFSEMLLLLLTGETPDAADRALLDSLFVALANPGPRHPAVRAAMTAAVSDSSPAHLVPIGLGVAGGGFLGGGETVESMRFLRRCRRRDPKLVADDISTADRPDEGDWHPAPGFGTLYGGIDVFTGQLARKIVGLHGDRPVLAWAHAFAEALTPHGLGWLLPGLAAAVFTELRLHPRLGAQLLQLAIAPGVVAHSAELISKPLTAMPWVDQAHYHMADESHD
jgi:citrate synthase